MEIITGYVGKAHVKAEQDRDINQGIIGPGSYVLKTGMQLAAEVSSNNEIKIRDGVLMHQGCAASIKKNTYDSLTIINGSQGMKRIDLIIARYEKDQNNGTESLELKVIQGTPAEANAEVPSYTEGDIQAGDYVADMPLYKVIIDGLNITEVKKVFEIVGSNKDLVDRSTCLPRTYKSQNFSGKVATGVVTPLKYTVPEDGYYFVAFKLEDMTNIESGYKLAYTSCPRTGWICAQSTGSRTTTDRFNASNIVYLKASDVVTLYYNHNSGGTVSINAVLICARLA